MSDCSQNHDSYQISPVSFEKRGRKKDLVLCCMAELRCSQAPQTEYYFKCKFKLFQWAQSPGRNWRALWIIYASSIPGAIAVSICFRKKSAQESKLENVFEAMSGTMAGNLYKMRSICPSLPLWVLTSKSTSFELLLDYKICHADCAGLTTLRMTALLFLQ